MKLLAIDTSSEACSAAILVDNDIQETYKIAPREHTKIILPMMESLLADAGVKLAQCDAIAFGRGPGSFTGIRIAASIAQALAVAIDLPVIPISSLLALAQGAYREFNAEYVLSCVDARMDEVYWTACGVGNNQVMELMTEESVARPENIKLPKEAKWFGIGNGFDVYEEILTHHLGKVIVQTQTDYKAHAYDIAQLAAVDFHQGKTCAPEDALPVYLRENMYSKRKHAL